MSAHTRTKHKGSNQTSASRNPTDQNNMDPTAAHETSIDDFATDPVLLAWTFEYAEKPHKSYQYPPEGSKLLFSHKVPLNCSAPSSIKAGSRIEVAVRQIDDHTLAVQTNPSAWRARHAEHRRKRRRVGSTAGETEKMDLIRMESDLAAVAELCSKIRRQRLPLAVTYGPYLIVGDDHQLSLEFKLALVADSVVTNHRHQALSVKLMAYVLQDDSLVDPQAHMAAPSTLMDIITRPHQDPGKIPKFLVPNLLTSLLPYQRESVSWCLRREGMCVNEKGEVEPLDASIRDYVANPPLGWRQVPGVDLWASPYYLRISSTDPLPPDIGNNDFAGKGLLSEEMGLGKTLEIMALLLLHPRPAASFERPLYAEHEVSDGSCVKRALRPIKATLVIAPRTILEQWASEFRLHAPSLKVLVVNWSMPKVDELAEADVVFVSYDQMSSWFYHTSTKKARNFRHNPNPEITTRCTLIDVQFWRVVLDEVQMVHTGDSAAAVTARRIPRVHAWAVSGTPVKNSLEDMRGITKFLDLQPFVEGPCWQRMIASPADLDHTMRHVAIRHTKASVADQLNLTPQHRKLILLKFATVERLRYDRLFQNFKQAAQSSNCNLSSWLLKLRQLCSHVVSGGGGSTLGGADGDSSALTLDQLLSHLVDEADSELWTEQSKKINAELRIGQLHDQNYEMPKAISIWKATLKEIEGHISSVKSRLDAAVKHHAEQKSKLEDLGAASEMSEHGDMPSSDLGEGPTLFDSEDDNQCEDQQEVDEDLEQKISDAKKDIAISASQVKVLKIRSRSLQELKHKVCFFLGTGYFRSSQRLKLDLKSQKLEESLQSDENQATLEANMEQEKHFYNLAETVRQELLREPELKVLELANRPKKFKLMKVYKYCPIPRSKTVDELADIIEAIATEVRNILEQPLIDENEAKRPEELGAGVQSESDAYSKTLDLQAHAFIYLDFLQVLFRDRAAAIDGGTIQPLPKFPPAEIPDGLEEFVKRREDIVGPLSIERRSLISIMKTTKTPLKVRDELHGEIRSCQIQYTTLRDLYNARVEYYRQLQNLSDQVKDVEHLTDVSQAIVYEQRKINAMDLNIARKQRDQTYIRNLEGGNYAASQLRSISNEENPSVEDKASENGILTGPCAICLDKIEDGAITSCGHTFCANCIFPWLETRNTCPICTRRLVMANVHKFSATSRDSKNKTDSDTALEWNKDSDEAYASELYVSISPRLYNRIHHIPLGRMYGIKIDMVVRHVLYLRSQDPTAQIVIFSQWANMLLFLQKALEENKIKAANTSAQARISINNFRENPEIACILLHSRAHVAGLTLINANHVFLCEPLLNTALELQAISRVNRIGQTRETFVWQFCVENTVEQTILGMTSRARLANLTNEAEIDSSALAEAPLQFGRGGKAPETELAGDNKALRRILFKEVAEASN